MESKSKCDGIDHNAPPLPIVLSTINNTLKLETLVDDYYLQDFHHLDHDHHQYFPLTASSFINPTVGIQSNSLDPSDPFFHIGSSSIFDFYEFKPYEENIGIYSTNCAAAMHQSFQGGGFPKPLRIVVPDESSCVTADNNNNNNNIGFHKENGMKISKYNNKNQKKYIKNSNHKNESVSTKRKPVLVKNTSKSTKGQWTIEEDRLLIHLVEKYGVRKWSRIAQILKGRIGKQCRERWHNHLRPDIKKDLWTEDEDRILIEAHVEVGNKWAEISKRLPGRTENSIKNHWNATKRRQFSRRKCKTKWPRPSSLLQNYIKSLNLQKEGRNNKSKNGNNNNNNNNIPFPTTNTNPEIFKNSQENMDDHDHMVPDYYDFDEFPDFNFHDDDQSFDSFIDDLPFDVPPLMHYEVKKEVDFFHGMKDMDTW